MSCSLLHVEWLWNSAVGQWGVGKNKEKFLNCKMLTLLSTVRQNLKCFYIYLDIYLPLVELEFSNINVAAVWHLGLSQSVSFRRLTTLVVIWQHHTHLDVVSCLFGTEPVWCTSSGLVETTTLRHSCTFNLFATNLHSMWSPTLNCSKEQSVTAASCW